MRSVTSLQIIIGDAGAEVMDVVKPNIHRRAAYSLFFIHRFYPFGPSFVRFVIGGVMAIFIAIS